MNDEQKNKLNDLISEYSNFEYLDGHYSKLLAVTFKRRKHKRK